MLAIYISINVVYCLHTSDRGLWGETLALVKTFASRLKVATVAQSTLWRAVNRQYVYYIECWVWAGRFKFVYSGLSVSERFA